MKISVIIPTHNEEKYIEQCLKALSSQEEPPVEIIVVDNNCTDRTVELASRFPVKVIQEKSPGIIPARNAGFDAATGDILARVDADVIVPPDWTKKIRLDFEKHEIDALTGPLDYYGFPFPQLFYKAYVNTKLYFAIARLVTGGRQVLVGPNMIITKDFWKKVKPTVCLDDTKIHEDLDLTIHILKLKGRILGDNKLVVKTSGRRLKNNPSSWFIDYHIRMGKSVVHYFKNR